MLMPFDSITRTSSYVQQYVFILSLTPWYIDVPNWVGLLWEETYCSTTKQDSLLYSNCLAISYSVSTSCLAPIHQALFAKIMQHHLLKHHKSIGYGSIIFSFLALATPLQHFLESRKCCSLISAQCRHYQLCTGFKTWNPLFNILSTIFKHESSGDDILLPTKEGPTNLPVKSDSSIIGHSVKFMPSCDKNTAKVVKGMKWWILGYIS